ncbi:hypothetical protein [Herbidospora mongoliensis]|uniref:hypothetical protein n=1 Tax=Herbidospora mongoliensis TaxID=688067 RepID=UPI00083304DD|nr:hypothetical protein [Herbidospora mongoliensis]
MSYGISFLRREPGQTWHDAHEALATRAPETVDYAVWSVVAVAAHGVLGVASEDLLNCEVTQLSTGLQAACYLGQWSVSVPYWPSGEAAGELATQLRAVSEIIERATGLTAYDPQIGAMLSEIDDLAGSAAPFDLTAAPCGS